MHDLSEMEMAENKEVHAPAALKASEQPDIDTAVMDGMMTAELTGTSAISRQIAKENAVGLLAKDVPEVAAALDKLPAPTATVASACRKRAATTGAALLDRSFHLLDNIHLSWNTDNATTSRQSRVSNETFL